MISVMLTIRNVKRVIGNKSVLSVALEAEPVL